MWMLEKSDLIKFIEWINSVFEEKIGIIPYNTVLINKIEKYYINIYLYFKQIYNRNVYIVDPFCYFYNNNCDECIYGKINGICGTEGSLEISILMAMWKKYGRIYTYQDFLGAREIRWVIFDLIRKRRII